MLATALLLVAATQQQGSLPLERLFADPPLEGAAPMQLKPSPGGAWLTFLKPSPEDSEVLDLWAMPMQGGDAFPLVKAKDLLGGAEEKLSEAERMERERKRIRHKGITSYHWCGESDRALLFPLDGDLRHVTLPAQRGGAPAVVRLTNDPEPELDPRCGKSGALVAYVKKGDVHVVDLKGKAKKLTKGATAARTFGRAEFIAQEEMGRFEGYWWSDDEKKLAVLEVDESAVGVKIRPLIYADRTELFEQRYPAAGEKNAIVKLHVVDVATGAMKPVPLPPAEYVARVDWAKDALLVQLQTRDQKKLFVVEAAPPAWKTRVVLTETDAAWVELTDDLKVLPGGDRFLWSSEADGARRLQIVDRKTGARAPLAATPEPVRELVGLDEARGVAFVTAGAQRGMEQHVWAIPLDGSPATKITTDPGVHHPTFDDTGKAFVDKHSRLGVPWKVALRRADGSMVQWIDDNPAAELQALARPTPVAVDVKATDGTPLNAILLPPVGATGGKKRPVLVYTYGGPHGQVVAQQWMRQYPFFVWLTQRGYGVFLVDNRGMGGRDRAFSRAIAKRFGDVEVEDLFAAVDALKKQHAWVDGARIGVWGWSYGGFLATRAMLDEKSPFAAAVAVAPVSEWRLYDTHYTERYLGLPADGAYEKASLLPRAKLLKKPLLLVHGMADDNVLFENTLQLVEAFQKEGAAFDLMVYPGRAHGLTGRQTQLHVYRTLARFFDRELTPQK